MQVGAMPGTELLEGTAIALTELLEKLGFRLV
jgi:hypothetical protein